MDLGGELYHVAVYIGAALAAEGSTREHAVEAVAKFMKHSLHFVEGEQGGGCRRRGG